MDDSTIAQRALTPGEQTSEHAEMTSSVASGKLLTILGAGAVLIPQLLELAGALPQPVLENKWVQLVVAGLGGLLAILGTIQGVAAKVAYIQGRSQIKAAALLDQKPATPMEPPPRL